MKRILALAAAFAIANAAWGAPVFVAKDQLALRLLPADRAAFEHRLGTDPKAAVALLDEADAIAATDPARGEWLLASLLRRLAAHAPTTAVRQRAQALTQHMTQAYTAPPDPDHARGARVPVADVAAAAGATLRQWSLLEHADALRAAWRRGGSSAADATDAPTVRRALDGMDASEVRLVLEAHANDLPIDALARAAARSGHAAAIGRVLRNGRGADALALVEGLPEREAPATAFAQLQTAAGNPALATAALRAEARLVPALPSARDALLDRLADPATGAAAAQALAELADGPTTARLAALLEGSARDAVAGRPASLATRRALLVLQRMPGREARAMLDGFVADARQPAALRAEVAGWTP